MAGPIASLRSLRPGHGRCVEMAAGDISFGEDQNTTPNALGQKGHMSGTVGDAPAVLMIVQMASAHGRPTLPLQIVRDLAAAPLGLG